MIVIVFGLPGSGKSYFASRLADKIHAGYVNSDRVRKELFEKRAYTESEKQAVYNEMLKTMNHAIAAKNDLILDATFHKKETREYFDNELNGRDDLYFIEVWSNIDTIKERLKKKRPFSDADYEVYKLISKRNEPLSQPHLVLESTNDNIDEMIEKALDYLKTEND